MPESSKSGPKILVLVGDWVEDYEAMIPIQALQMLGADVHVVSPGKTKGQLVLSCVHDFDRSNIDGATDVLFANNLGITASGRYLQYQAVSERYGHAVLITQDFEAVAINNYAGLFVPGGRSPETLQLDDKIIEWVRHIDQAGKPVMSLCHGIQVLAAADILKGRRCTGHPCCRPQAQSAGALWEPTDLMSTVVDGNLVTAAEWTGQPGMLATFARAIGFTFAYQPRT
jgi:protease I